MLIFDTPPQDFISQLDSVGIFCIHQGKILHLWRQDHKTEGNTWAGPGGKMDVGESPRMAMRRELHEETSIWIDDQDIERLEHIKTYYVRYPNKDFVYHKFRLHFDEEPAIQINEQEHKGFDWFTPAEALEHDLLLGEDEVIKDVYNIT